MLHTYAYVYRSSFLLSVQAKVSGRLILVETGLNERNYFDIGAEGPISNDILFLSILVLRN